MARTVQQQIIKQWMEGTENDMEAAKRLDATPGILADIIYFHCRQLAENALQGYLSANGRVVAKTRDLMTLLEQCRELAPEFAKYVSECTTLNNWVLKPADTHTALKSAETILSQVKSKLTGMV